MPKKLGNLLVFAGLFVVALLLIIYISSSSPPEPPKGWQKAVDKLQSGPQPEEVLIFFEGDSHNTERSD